jgi:NADPH:quinone reductase-like Zn-dependent oxidoreductase
VRNFNAVSPREFSMPAPLWLPTRLAIGIRKPRVKILGSEFAGEVEAIGQNVTQFKVGDAVFGYLAMKMGANADYLCVAQDGIVTHKPDNLSYVEAAAVPYGALTALNLLRKANIQPGQKVLINGASGSIGSAALQLAKHYGAEVTGVCGTPRVDYVQALGADKIIDYTQEDFTQNGETYDLIFDIIRKTSFAQCQDSLTENGIYLLASFKLKQVFQMVRTARDAGKKVICAMAFEKPADLLHIKELIEAGVLKSIVDKTYPLEQTAEAHRYFESGQKKGPVVITMPS